MNDEIKKINLPKKIEKAFECIDNELSVCNDELLEILNYITNLQEENESLKELNICVGCNSNPDYKSRIDKAIEYISENKNFLEELKIFDLFEIDERGYANKLLEILEGGKK